jgi:predicted nucleic acid-binding Zn ribbon protein
MVKGRFGGSAKTAELWSHWKEIVGEDVADHCFPERIVDGEGRDFPKLYVKADSPIWRQQVDLLKEEIKEKINQKLENLYIEKLIFK